MRGSVANLPELRAIYGINKRGGELWQYMATAGMQQLIERARRVRSAMEQIERYLSRLTDRRIHSEAIDDFSGCSMIWLDGRK